MYTIPARPHRIQETIQRSKFIATVAHAPTAEEGKECISRIKDEFPDATHNCWAYVAGPPGDTARVGMSDDGEPHGTAGKPMLTVLLHSGIGEVVAVVTRYFGGTKLGTGGLVRAYSGAVKKALEGIVVEERRDTLFLSVMCDYAKLNCVRQMIHSFHAQIAEERYEADVCFEIEISRKEEESFVRSVTDLTGGEVVVFRA